MEENVRNKLPIMDLVEQMHSCVSPENKKKCKKRLLF